MSEREMYVTSEGYKALEEELTFLKGARRQEVARRLHDALGEGELIENAELEDARREQSFVEGRIITLEEQLRKLAFHDPLTLLDPSVNLQVAAEVLADCVRRSFDETLAVGRG